MTAVRYKDHNYESCVDVILLFYIFRKTGDHKNGKKKLKRFHRKYVICSNAFETSYILLIIPMND